MEDVPFKDTGDDQALTRACTPHATLNYPRVNITVSTSVPSILCFHYMADLVSSSPGRGKARTGSDNITQVFLDTVSGTASTQ